MLWKVDKLHTLSKVIWYNPKKIHLEQLLMGLMVPAAIGLSQLNSQIKAIIQS